MKQLPAFLPKLEQEDWQTRIEHHQYAIPIYELSSNTCDLNKK